MSNPVLFFVEDGGTLATTDFDPPKTRRDVYKDIADDWSNSPQHLYSEIHQCQPLVWKLNSLYDDHRAQIVDSLELVTESKGLNKLRISALNKRLDQLPEDPYEGADDWLLGLSNAEFQEKIVPAIQRWLNSEPDWVNETDYFPDASSAQELALQYFQGMASDVLDALGVIIVEGEHPGGTYYAAELGIGIDEANLRAIKLNISVKFARR